MRRAFFLSILMFGGSSLFALDNGLARTPPMGWNSWNKFACNVSESLIREAADAIVSTGMKDAGYQYVVIDDCWQVSRDADGNIVPDAKRFPGGMKALADYIHSKGLKFGIYSDAGTGTCQNRPGGRERQDDQERPDQEAAAERIGRGLQQHRQSLEHDPIPSPPRRFGRPAHFRRGLTDFGRGTSKSGDEARCGSRSPVLR